jgi:ribosomal protein S18 acetylase RimI-like enzyme
LDTERVVPGLKQIAHSIKCKEQVMAAILSDARSQPDNVPVTIRAIRPEDVESCGRAAYAAHTTVAMAHNVPCEHPSIEFSIGLIGNKVRDPNAVGFTAERGGRILGSVFLNTFPDTPVAAIGPLTVDPAAEGAAGRRLMQAAIDEACNRRIEQVRLVQSPSHLRSLALYSKLGFQVREPLVLVTGRPLGWNTENYDVRPATMTDLPDCDRLCTAVHGFARTFELRVAIEQKSARVVERVDHISGYSTGLGFRGYAIGETTEDLKLLIGTAPAVMGPGFFVPIRNGELLRWLFDNGFRASWPASLMTRGHYQEVTGAFMPSIAF